MKKLFPIFLCLLSFTLTAQKPFVFASKEFRAAHDKKLTDSIIKRLLGINLTDSTEAEWRKAFWAMELMLYKTSYGMEKLTLAWLEANNLSESFQRSLLEVTYTLYPRGFERYVSKLLTNTSSVPIFIRSAEYLHRVSRSRYDRLILQLMQKKFYASNLIGLKLLRQRLEFGDKTVSPCLKALFNPNFLPGETVIFSLQRKNRAYPGIALIRKANGELLRNDQGELFHTEQLARAITNYPFYITNGNTPQGIFRWTGFDSSSNSYIGPTTNLQMVMPYESTPSEFFHDSIDNQNSWNKELYGKLLPGSWKNYEGIYESFYAGAMGRTEVIMHGTAINPAYYQGQSYYPNTPSMGCLCSYEEWDNAGMLVKSNQQVLVDALKSIGASNGYVVVVNLDDQQDPVRLGDIMPLIR